MSVPLIGGSLRTVGALGVGRVRGDVGVGHPVGVLRGREAPEEARPQGRSAGARRWACWGTRRGWYRCCRGVIPR